MVTILIAICSLLRHPQHLICRSYTGGLVHRCAWPLLNITLQEKQTNKPLNPGDISWPPFITMVCFVLLNGNCFLKNKSLPCSLLLFPTVQSGVVTYQIIKQTTSASVLHFCLLVSSLLWCFFQASFRKEHPCS